MMEAALKNGLFTKMFKRISSADIYRAIDNFYQNELSPNSWMDMVASKGGTTRAALDSSGKNKCWRIN